MPINWYTRRNKTIVFLGGTGTGKTTSINSMMNYLYNIKIHDSFRCKLIHEKFPVNLAESQTSDVNIYYIENPPRLSYNLTVIDTPGYNDTQGANTGKIYENLIKDLFKTRIKECNMICFVIQASLTRLTENQQFIFNQITTLFSKNIRDNLFILVTWCDPFTTVDPLGIRAVKLHNVPYTKYFKINNEAFFLPTNRGSADKWNLLMQGFKEMFAALHTAPTTSLMMMKKVLQKRDRLLTDIAAIQPEINILLEEMQNIEVLMHVVRTACKAINAPNSTILLTKYILVRYKKDVSYISLVCDSCKRTCCENCTHWHRLTCDAMNWGGSCRICRRPRSCSSKHKFEKYVYDAKWESVKVTGKELLKRLQKKRDQKHQQKISVENLSESEQIIEGLILDVNECKDKFFGLANNVRNCIFELSEIALRPQVLTLEQYIDKLIEDEKQHKHKTGWEKRVMLLMELKESGNQASDHSSFFSSKALSDLKDRIGSKKLEISNYS